MAKLNAAARKRIPSSEFGLPKQRKYPMEEEKGRLSAGSAKKIIAKANRLLKEK